MRVHDNYQAAINLLLDTVKQFNNIDDENLDGQTLIEDKRQAYSVIHDEIRRLLTQRDSLLYEDLDIVIIYLVVWVMRGLGIDPNFSLRLGDAVSAAQDPEPPHDGNEHDNMNGDNNVQVTVYINYQRRGVTYSQRTHGPVNWRRPIGNDEGGDGDDDGPNRVGVVTLDRVDYQDLSDASAK